MKRVDNGSQVAGNLYTDGNPSTGVLGTVVDASCLNAIQEEIVNVVLDANSGVASLSQNNSTLTQLNTAIKGIIDSKILATDGIMVKNTQASLGSNSIVTATSATASGLSVAYTPIVNTNDRYIYGVIDWNVNDPDGPVAEAYIELQFSTDNSTWTTLETYTRSANLGAGAKEVKVTEATQLASDAITTSTTYQATGLSLAYTPINGANIRYVEFQGNMNTVDNSDGQASNQVQLQYSNDNSTWSSLSTITNQQVTPSANTGQIIAFFDSVRHNQTTTTPYYRVAHRSNPSNGGTSYINAGANLRVREVEEQYVINNRNPITFFVKHNLNTGTPYYRVAHRVLSGDQSTIYTGSVLRVMEFS
jgi:hypothetical protein